ncbi:hypothetical protein L4932_13550 [Staphylococcus aureus]|uniref:AclX n=1 Tax=Staphylococcus aureus TaxID=1280 RepID=X4Y5Z7_STAAU|nr:hypothetical protein [Staphylococcus aureus]AHV78688.1 AclX [Staphylococcus aureus]ATV90641.1 AclX [Staphylococcus aureus]MDN4125449.1 hypothetical protein [Staphylococcus aureus]PCF67960.1 hypothetical protein CKO30_14645 [Staphylococcus aureus]
MKIMNLPLYNHFTELRDKPKWALKFILGVLIFALSKIIGFYNTDMNQIYKHIDLSAEQMSQMNTRLEKLTIIGAPLMAIIQIFLTFIIILILSKIMKSDVTSKVIFSAILSYSIIIGSVTLIVTLIQFMFGLSPLDYRITSLNIFSKGNSFLELFDLQIIFGAYVFGIMLFATNHFSKKNTCMCSFIYILIFIGLGLLGVISNQS